MKNLAHIYLVSLIVIIACIVTAVPSGTVVDSANDCDTGYARLIASANETMSLICIDEDAVGQQAIPLDTIYNAQTYLTHAESATQGTIDVQVDLAESNSIWSDYSELYWDYKFNGYPDEKVLGVNDYIGSAWNYIWAFIVLCLEIIKLLFYLAELILVIYILFTLIPETFFKLRDTLARSYIRRQST